MLSLLSGAPLGNQQVFIFVAAFQNLCTLSKPRMAHPQTSVLSSWTMGTTLYGIVAYILIGNAPQYLRTFLTVIGLEAEDTDKTISNKQKND